MTDRGLVLLPSLNESTELHELQHNLDETEAYTNELTTDKEKLQQTYQDCTDTLKKEFEDIREALNRREETMLAQLDKKYKDRDDKLQRQLDALDNHERKNEQTCEECKDTIATVSNKGIPARTAREKTIRENCQSCIDDSPVIEKVPINLNHTFDAKRRILTELEKFSELKYTRIEAGKHLPFTRLNAKVVNNVKKVGAKISLASVPLMEMSAAALKYDRQNQRLTVEIRCKDTKLDAGDDKEQEEAMREAYNTVKNENTFVHVQIHGADDKKWDGWDNGELDQQYCKQLLSLPQQGRDRYILYVDKGFEPGAMVHMRARLVQLEDAQSIDDDGSVDDSEAIKVAHWSKSKNTTFGKVGKVASPASNENSNVSYDNPGSAVNSGIGEMGSYGNNGEQEEMGDIGGGNKNNSGNAPDRLKIKCVMQINGQDVKKAWTLASKRNEHTYDALLEKARKVAKTKKVENHENLQFTFMIGDNAVANQGDFDSYCINAPDPSAINMTAVIDD